MADVIVIGAGPAGSIAAATLAKAGRHVLLVDRASFPRDKTCGDAIQAGAVRLLRQVGYTAPLDPALFTKVTRWSIEAPSGAVIAAQLQTNGHDPHVAPRYHFDALVYQQAISNGAEFLQAQATGPIREAGRVVGITAKRGKETLELRATVVIAADGATSVIARELIEIPDEDVHWAIAVRGYAKMRDKLNGSSEFYFPKIILPGYAWVFPVGDDEANIGIGMRLDKYRQQRYSLREMLDLFLDKLGDRVDRSSLREVKSWQLPFASKAYRRAYDGCILVGDAGRFIDPLLGAGIYFGMRTGVLAASVVDAALHEGNTSQRRLSEFEQLWKRELGWPLMRATLVQKVVIGYPRILNTVIGIGRLNAGLARWIVMSLSGEKL